MVRGRGKLTPQDYDVMRIISHNINELLTTGGYKQIELSRNTKIPPSTLTGYVKGTTLPIPGNVEKIAKFFGVKKSDIDPRFDSNKKDGATDEEVLKLNQSLSRDGNPSPHKRWIDYGDKLLSEQMNQIQEPEVFYIYDFYDSPASAGTGQYLGEVSKESIELPVYYDADFVIKVDGDSMEPEYSSGDYVFVKLNLNLASGKVGVFQYNGNAYIKEIIYSKDHALLHSFNKGYEDMEITEDSGFRAIGEVVGKYRG